MVAITSSPCDREPNPKWSMKSNATRPTCQRRSFTRAWYSCLDKGIASCADVETGEVQWVERMSTGFSGSPIRAGDKIYTITDDGELLCIAGTKDFKLLGKTDLEEPSRSTPAVHDGHMYLRTKSHLICVEQSAS